MENGHKHSSEEQAGRAVVAPILIWGGVLLLVVGGALGYPFVTSRLAAPQPTQIPATDTPAPSPTLTQRVPTETPAPTTTPIPPSATPSPSPTPTNTPTPAVPSRIVIPEIGVDAPVVPISWETAEGNSTAQAVWQVPDKYAAGWHDTSAPLGVVGNTVLNGHNTTYGEVFRDLYTLEPGDSISLYSADTPYTYEVSEILILPEGGQPLEVRLENARYILPTDDERLTLVTCHPYGSLRNRLIVIAFPQE